MSTTGTSSKTSQAGGVSADDQVDVLPPVDDDTDPPARETRQEQEPPPKREDDEAQPIRDEGRDRITNRFREYRAAQEAKALEEEQPADEGGEEQPAAVEEPPVEEQPPAAEAAPAPRKHKLFVDGRQVELSDDEVLRHAQINLSADNRLDAATRILAEAKQVARPPGEKSGTEQPTQSQSTSEPAKPFIDPEITKRIGERVQVGDSEEAGAALAEFAQEILQANQAQQPKGLSEEEVERRVDAKFTKREVKVETDAAVSRFNAEYPELTEPLFKDVVSTAVRDELVADLKKAGATDEDLKELPTTRQLAEAHHQLRLAGYGDGLRSYGDILDTAAGRIGKTLKIEFASKKGKSEPAPAAKPAASVPPQNSGKSQQSQASQPQRIAVDPAEAQRRIDRKREAPQQPKTASVRGGTDSQQRPKTRKEVVAEMRRGRPGQGQGY